eukprot:12923887-Prorocentrum_lima.AAC.1
MSGKKTPPCVRKQRGEGELPDGGNKKPMFVGRSPMGQVQAHKKQGGGKTMKGSDWGPKTPEMAKTSRKRPMEVAIDFRASLPHL